MKRNVIALGVATAISVLAGNAFAGVVLNTLNAGADARTDIGSAATDSDINPAGIGHKLVFPYFTTQGDNATLINIVNTDTKYGKALKVRFRGAGNSDDLYDFQVLMSPGDVWTAAVTQNADGVSQLSTSDKTCTIPSSVNGAFTNVNRLDSTKDTAPQTREGYIEVINMADIVDTTATTDLFTRVKHVSGVAPCSGAAIEALVADITVVSSTTAPTGLIQRGLGYPTTGLAGDWIILNQASTAAWSGSAKAIQANGYGNAVFFPQTDASYDTLANDVTADPLLVGGIGSIVAAASFDFPDLSTRYDGAITSFAQRNNTTDDLAVATVNNEYVTDDTIAAVTDLLFTQPMRRYFVAADYSKTSGAASSLEVRNAGTNAGAYYVSGSTTVVDRLICLKSVNFRSWDREETTTSTQFVISPGVSTTYNICGEAAVTSINNGGVTTGSALNATVARNNIEVPYTDGWMAFNLVTTGATGNVFGLPVIGASFMRASNGAVNYGFAFPHKTTAGVN